MVNDLLVQHFPQIVDINFTAKMEEDLDRIAEGQVKWTPVIKEFYGPFHENLLKKETEVEKRNMEEKNRRSLPQMRETDGHQARTVWKVYGLLRLPGMQNSQTGQKCV